MRLFEDKGLHLQSAFNLVKFLHKISPEDLSAWINATNHVGAFEGSYVGRLQKLKTFKEMIGGVSQIFVNDGIDLQKLNPETQDLLHTLADAIILQFPLSADPEKLGNTLSSFCPSGQVDMPAILKKSSINSLDTSGLSPENQTECSSAVSMYLQHAGECVSQKITESQLSQLFSSTFSGSSAHDVFSPTS